MTVENPTFKKDKELISQLKEVKQRLANGDTTAILPALKLIEEAETCHFMKKPL